MGQGGSGSDVLHKAAEKGDLAAIEALIKKYTGFDKKAFVNARDTAGNTPLYYAAIKGHRDVVQLLIDNGAAGHKAVRPPTKWHGKGIKVDTCANVNRMNNRLEELRKRIGDARSSSPEYKFLAHSRRQLDTIKVASARNPEKSFKTEILAIEEKVLEVQWNIGLPEILQTPTDKTGPPPTSDDPLKTSAESGAGVATMNPQATTNSPHVSTPAGPPPNTAATQPRQLSNFSIDFDSELGIGGSATVYKAFDNVTNKPVAVKVQPVGSLDAEAKLLTQLKHPNIVQVLFFDDGVGSSHATGPPASKLFLELVDGGSLDKLIESSAPLPEEEIRRYLSAILQALDCVHTQSPPVFHRDVKPANMLLTKDGTLKLTDFGCARVQGKTGTTATIVAGTWVCLAPEACLGKPCAASDLWATACSVVHMASGRPPWDETGLKDFPLGTHISKPNPPLNHYPIVPQTLSAPLQALLRKMFAHNPEHRGTAASHLKDPYFTNEIPSPAPTAGGGSAVASAFPQWILDLPVSDDVRAILVKEEIDEECFDLLDGDDLKELGLAFGPRKMLLNAIAKRKGK